MRHALSRRGQWPDYLNIQGCRITTESGVPVSTSDRTSQGNLYLTPANGNLITLPTGVKNSYVTIPFAETLLGLTITSGKNYDAFAYLLGNSGFGYDLGPAWTDDTTRATAVELFNGYYVNSASFVGTILGKTIPIRRGLLVGTIRASGTNVTEDSQINRFVWNKFNQVPRVLSLIDTTSHTFTTIQEWRAGTQFRIYAIFGEPASIFQHATVRMTGTVDTRMYVNLDGTTDGPLNQIAITGGVTAVTYSGTRGWIVAAGYHFVTVREESNGGTGTHDFGNNNAQIAD